MEDKKVNVHQYINVYEYTENNELNILDFKQATEEWLKFVFMNRQSDELVNKYDIVIGSVANDNLYQVLVNYEEGIYNVEETIKRLKTYLLSNQISFHTPKSLECIKYIETIEVDKWKWVKKFTCILLVKVQGLCNSIKNYFNLFKMFLEETKTGKYSVYGG